MDLPNGCREWSFHGNKKKTDEIRLCMDTRDANKTILRTRHVSPTLDELITELNGATMFSKIDLRSGYHQLVLHPSCRYITTFATHVGLYPYKRLSLEINTAAEVFLTIQLVIQDVPGSLNISDDIVMFVRENIIIHNCWLQPKCCSIQEQCIAFPIEVGCSWLMNMEAAAKTF